MCHCMGALTARGQQFFRRGISASFPKRRRKNIEIPLRQMVLGNEKALQPIKRDVSQEATSTAKQAEEMYFIREVQIFASCSSALRTTFFTATLDLDLNRFA